MSLLGVDTTSADWRKVVEWCRVRIAEQTAVCISTTASDRQREQAAHRIAALEELLAAPGRAQEVVTGPLWRTY